MRDAGAGRGRGLFATRAFAAREVILREPAVAWQMGGSLASPYAVEALDAIVLQCAPFCLTRESAARAAALTRSEAVVSAFDHNAYGVVLGDAAAPDAAAGAADDSRALFPVVGLANSDCDANAAAQQAAPGSADAADMGGLPVSVVTARRAIAAGEEITTAYVPRAWSQAARRAALEATWGFECACARCAAPADDTAVSRCGACGGAGRVFWTPARSGACEDCGACAQPLRAAAAPDAPLGVPDAPPRGATLAQLRAATRALLHHEFLSTSDARVFAALSRALDACAGARVAARDRAAAQALANDIAQALAEAALKSKFTSLDDLGIDVLTE